MTDAFYDFEWTVAPRYEWQDWLDEDGKPLVVPKTGYVSVESAAAVELTWNRAQGAKKKSGPVLRPILKDRSELRRYYPMQRQHAALFREFGELDYTSESSVLEFAQKYGALGLPVQTQSIRVLGDDGELRHHHAYGEPFLGWALEICLMREGIRLESRRRTTEAARRLKWLFDRNLQHVQARMGFSPAGEPSLTLEPLTLISAMWLQLALAVTGEKRFVACKFCRRMFEISTEFTGFRSHREFCSDSCKTKDYRKRKRTALRLAAAGSKLTEIAARTSTEEATVRSWMAAPKKTKRKTATEGK